METKPRPAVAPIGDDRLAQSRRAFTRASESLAGGVGSYARGTSAGYKVPITVGSADGAVICDVDGNKYIDYLLALGPLILGHRPRVVEAAVREALERYGSMVGLNTELEAAAAELVVRAVPAAELVRFSNSGTEAVMMAVRIARAYTRRPLIVRFEGHFHGWSDVAHWSVKPAPESAGDESRPIPVPAVPGIPDVLASTMIVLPWNDAAALEETLRQHGDAIAAVITEPIMANMGCIEPTADFLAQVRALTQRFGCLLIFDEVITGFRLSLGGAQSYYNVTPDLATFAKALGGGYPIAAVVGRRDVMNIVATGELPYLGTYNTNPIAMAAVYSTISALARPGTYEHLTSLGARLADGLRREMTEAGIPATIRGHGTVFQLWFTRDPARTYRDGRLQGKPVFYQRFHQAMLSRGVLFHPSQFEHFFVSTAHTDKHVDDTLEAAHLAIREIAPEFS